ncbi:MAG: NAD(P)/FAD-dependent oxidoreductase [Paludibacteraceae bacterium]|nr:NAD(P)/FAD-dependent oxidoreductase [Paludibacteraceae bacterium]
MKVAIIGAGAAGCFCAVNLKRTLPKCEIDIYEAGTKPLAKVAITGGGRCNLTNSWEGVKSLGQVYPRGERLIKRLFHQLDNRQTMDWWEKEGVRLVTQDDHCVFPASQDAMTIVNLLTANIKRLGIGLHLSHRVTSIEHNGEYTINFHDEHLKPVTADTVVVATGGHPKESGFNMLKPLELAIEPPVPSLFTFCVHDQALNALQGVVVEDTVASIAGTKFKAEGPLLITHWGMSGPAILKTSSQAARHLADNAYKANLLVDWWPAMSQDEVMAFLSKQVKTNGAKQVSTIAPPPLTHRHWAYLIGRIGISETKRWNEIGKKDFNRMVQLLKADTYAVDGKGQFKDEFVTCGGVALTELDPNTLECKKHPRLYFAGEVTDVDAVTGGFNLQAAWTMGYVVAQAVANKDNQD